MADYRKLFEQALLAQQGQQDPLQKQLEGQIMAKSQGASMAPTISLIDSIAGTNLSSAVPKEESMKEKLGQLLQMRQQQQAQKLNGLGQLAKMQTESEERSAERQFKEKMYDLQLATAKMKAAQGAKPKIGSEDKAKLGFTTTLLRELPKLRAQYEQGGGTIRPGFVGSILGQNQTEQIANALAENYGRLQSGGAISKDEEGRFLTRLGSMMDSNEIKLEKLKQIEQEIMDKHSLYGGDLSAFAAPSTNARTPSGGSASARGAGGVPDLNSMSLQELELYNASL